MIGILPTKLTVNGAEYKIRSDYRNVLRVFEALGDEELSDEEKLYVTLDRLYEGFEDMPKGDYQEAYLQAVNFMECHDRKEDRKNPQLIDWEKDEHLIFPAINAVAGCEVRLVEYMHWWTFLGYFENIDNESLWSFVLSIRQKRAKGKKLEKYEREFFNNNREMCSLNFKHKARKAEDALEDMFNELLEEGGNA